MSDSSPRDNNPWATLQASTLESSSLGTPVLLEIDNAEAEIADTRSEASTEQPTRRWNGQGMDRKSQDDALEQQHLTRQLRNLAQELKKTRAQAAAARALQVETDEPSDWTARELRLARDAVHRWKGRRSFVLAEEILTRAVDLKEANVIACVNPSASGLQLPLTWKTDTR